MREYVEKLLGDRGEGMQEAVMLNGAGAPVILLVRRCWNCGAWREAGRRNAITRCGCCGMRAEARHNHTFCRPVK